MTLPIIFFFLYLLLVLTSVAIISLILDIITKTINGRKK